MACIGANRRCHVLFLLAPLVTVGCVRTRVEVRDSLEARILPVVDPTKPADAMVLPAAAERGQGLDGTLPPALEPVTAAPPRPIEAVSPAPPATGVPEGSAGQTLTLPEAIGLAFRLQPRLRAQLESIAQARGREQIAFS